MERKRESSVVYHSEARKARGENSHTKMRTNNEAPTMIGVLFYYTVQHSG